MRYKAYVERQPWDDFSRLRVLRIDGGPDKDHSALSQMVWTRYAQGSECPVVAHIPTFEMREMLGAFAEAAWEDGWRPEGYAQDSAAKAQHLIDMRRIAFGKLNIEEP